MKLCATALFVCFATRVSAQSDGLGAEPSPMEAFANQPGAHTIWSEDVAVLERDGARAVVTAVVIAQGSKRMRGAKVELSNAGAHDVVYLDEQATRRTRDALEEIANALSRHVPNGCMGAREFWPLYDWPWNAYHELNAEQCVTLGNPTLVLSGRGRNRRFAFAGETAGAASSIFTSAMEHDSKP